MFNLNPYIYPALAEAVELAKQNNQNSYSTLNIGQMRNISQICEYGKSSLAIELSLKHAIKKSFEKIISQTFKV